MDKYKELFNKNLNFQLETFGKTQNLMKIHLKLQEEVKELQFELLKYPRYPKDKDGQFIKIGYEIADCMILLQALIMYTIGYDLSMELLDKKIEINMNRRFELQPDGTFKHIKEDLK